MMNRIGFIGQINQQLISIDDIINYFDHSVAAYELVKTVNDANISGEVDKVHSSLKITINSPELNDLQDTENYIKNTLHNQTAIYGRVFVVDTKLDDSSIELFVRGVS